jgi:hypothetical protein
MSAAPPGDPSSLPYGSGPSRSSRSRRPLVVVLLGVVAVAGVASALLLIRDDDSDVAAGDIASSTAPTPTTVGTGTTTSTTVETGGGEIDYDEVVDDTGVISVEVPSTWRELDGRPIEAGPNLQASPDLTGFRRGFDVPGLSVTVLQAQWVDLDLLLDYFLDDPQLQANCTSTGRADLAVGGLTGRIESLADCGGVGTTYTHLVAVPADRSYTVEMNVQLTEDDAPAILDHVTNTLTVTQ